MANNSDPKRRDNYSSGNISDLDGAKKQGKQDTQCKMNEHQRFKAKQHWAPIT